MTISIRPMIKEDKPVLVNILGSTPEFKPSEVSVAEEVIDSYLRDPQRSGYFVFVAEVETAVVGYICYGPTPMTEGTWDMYWLAVSVEKRGNGIGTALVAHAEDRISEAQGRLVIIETSSMPEYEMTRHFHIRQGYDMIAHIPDFYALGDDKLIMAKRLS